MWSWRAQRQYIYVHIKREWRKKEGKFGTLTSDLDRMCDLTVQESVSEVVMESTGIYPKMSIKIQHIDNEHLSFSDF